MPRGVDDVYAVRFILFGHTRPECSSRSGSDGDTCLLYTSVLTYGEFFAVSQTEFPQTTASFNASFSEVTRFRLGYTVSFFSTGGNPVSYTHLDVYKRQAYPRSDLACSSVFTPVIQLVTITS